MISELEAPVAPTRVGWVGRIPNRWGDDRYAIHQHLWKAFPFNHGEDQPCLFRVETDTVLVRARVEPYWEGQRVQEEVPTHVGLVTTGAVVRLNMHLNVSRRCSGQDLPIRPEDVDPFVHRKITQMGLSVVSHHPVGDPFFVRSHERVPLFPVRVDAQVRVDDSEALARALFHGVGRMKYLGFGLPVLT